MVLALAQAPWFSWWDHALSDLGTRPASAPWFNGAMLLAGVLGLGFAAGFPASQRPAGRAGRALLGAAFLGLVGVGLFPADLGLAHDVAAGLYFVAAPMGVLALGHDARTQGARAWARLCTVLGAAALGGFVALGVAMRLAGAGGIAIPEAWHVAFLVAWALPAARRAWTRAGAPTR
jgi:hypothetical membrane protein